MKKKGIMIFIFLLSITFISAQPPFQQSETLIGIDIEAPIIETHTLNQDFSFHLHTYNATDGTRFTNDTVSCVIHLYDPITGKHLIEENMTFDSNGIDFEFEVKGGNFTKEAQYAVLLDCQDTNVGGFFEYGFDVTKTGGFADTGETLMYIIILFFILLLLALALYIAIITPYQNLGEMSSDGPVIVKVTKTKYVKIMAFWFSYALFQTVITILAGMTNNYIQFEPMKDIFTSSYLFLTFLSYGVSLTAIVLLIWNTWKDIILNKKILEGGSALLREL